MRIEKRFTIDSVQFHQGEYRQVDIVLSGRDQPSKLYLDCVTLIRHGIPISHEIVGTTMVCICTSKEVARDRSETGERMGQDDVDIQFCQKVEKNEFHYYGKTNRLDYTLHLGTPQGMGSVNVVPCPSYELILDLSEAEYEQCKVLPPNTVFSLEFKLAD